MDQTTLAPLVTTLANAWRNPATPIPAEPFANLSADDAIAVQAGLIAALGETITVCKVGKDGNGRGVVAPIVSARVVQSGGTLSVPPIASGFTGIEVEVAIRLKHDITPEIAAKGEAAVAECIQGYVLGIELVGSRFIDKARGGAYGPLADCLNTAGYVVGEAWPSTQIDGTPLVIDLDGTVIYAAPASHALGGVMAPVLNYAKDQFDRFGALKAGMIMTTGTLCGLVPVAGLGKLTAKVGDSHQVSVILA